MKKIRRQLKKLDVGQSFYYDDLEVIKVDKKTFILLDGSNLIELNLDGLIDFFNKE